MPLFPESPNLGSMDNNPDYNISEAFARKMQAVSEHLQAMSEQNQARMKRNQADTMQALRRKAGGGTANTPQE